MHRTKLLSIGFATLLLLSAVMAVTPVSADPAPAGGVAIWAQTPTGEKYVNGSEVGLGNTFIIEVWINVSDTCGDPLNPGIFAFAYWFTWNDTLLELQSYTGYEIKNGVWEYGYSIVADELKDTDANTRMDTHSYAHTALKVPTAFQGVKKMSEYVLKVVYQPTYPEPDLSCALDVTNKGFIDSNEDTIPDADMLVVDGDYEIFSGLPPTPELEVKDPRDHDHLIERCKFPLGTKFNVTVCIKLLHWGMYFRAFEAKLKYDTTLLNFSNAYNGTFMELFGKAFYVNITYEDLGILVLAGTYLGEPTTEPGTSPPCAPGYGPAQGVLMTIEFLVTNVSIAPTMYQCEIGLYDTTLLNSTQLPIAHIVSSNLTYYACYTTLGWWLDCFTDSFRKKCITPFLGVGPNETADSYEPQDLVILYAYLEYNKEPEAYKLVEFEIHGPPNPYYNISIYRTAWTNESGIATINFTIPGSGFEHWREMVFGHWECYQAAQVKIYQKPEDWLYWKVGWIIEITDVEVIVPQGQTGAKKGQQIDIIVHYKTIMFIEKEVVFTVVVLDELLDPIQWDVWEVRVAPTEPILCSFREDVTHVLSTIPPWAHVGLATVYVNAFTALPMDCGCSYCPEVTETFWVVATADP